MSNNSIHGNDENLLEIKRSPQLAAIYLAEFLRLFEHYRARAHPRFRRPVKFRSASTSDAPSSAEAIEVGSAEATTKPAEFGFKLAPDDRWARKFYEKGTPEFRSRVAFAAPL